MSYAVIFDMDGVLIDSHEMVWDSVNNVLGKHGVKLTEEDVKAYVGRSFKDDVDDWNRIYGLNLELRAFTEEVWALEVQFLESIKPDSKLVSLLKELNSKNVPLAVGTSSQRFRADLILDQLKFKQYFPVVVSAEDVKRHKPAPDLFLEAAKRLSTPPKRCIVFEDARGGIEAAKKGNMQTVGYENGYNDGEVKEADLVIRDFSQVSYSSLSRLFS